MPSTKFYVQFALALHWLSLKSQGPTCTGSWVIFTVKQNEVILQTVIFFHITDFLCKKNYTNFSVLFGKTAQTPSTKFFAQLAQALYWLSLKFQGPT